ncbi:MAG: fused MFS/spermidine synthase [Syntrophales bacterium]|nr:fused MFS/spermidine synthase [Syntrophales bacterium]
MLHFYTRSGIRHGGMGIYGIHLVVFLGAFLLFGMEPLTGRLLVPFFGGAVHIWLVCIVYFQLLLLFGYLYAHFIVRHLGMWHLLIVLLPIINLPLRIDAPPSPTGEVADLFGTLTKHIALPFLVLSTTVVVVQLWVVHAKRRLSFNPYVLYATSNAGSLLALISYPILMEPFLGLKKQSLSWSVGYILYVIFVFFAWFYLRPQGMREGREHSEHFQRDFEGTNPVGAAGVEARNAIHWLVLSFLTSALLVTVTNLIAVEIGSFPLVWVLPLAMYLLSFVITFRDTDRISLKLMFLWPEVVLLGFALYFIPVSKLFVPFLLLLVFFILCIMIHGDLYRSRPESSLLSRFYIAVALGGFLGGMAVTLGAPLVFREVYEYPIMLVLIAILFAMRYRGFLLHSLTLRSAVVCVGRVFAILALYSLLIFFSGVSLAGVKREAHRNYYGICRIYDYPSSRDAPGGVRVLIHGSTIHGLQFLDREGEMKATLYYHPKSGLKDVLDLLNPPRRIAVVGLGTGTFGLLTRKGDSITYYEIDPDMERLSRRWFTFLENTPADLKVVNGDGRLKLKMNQERYDLIFVDAFSGDALPTHLITKEALQIYFDHLEENGFLILHLSNRYYELRGVVKAILENMGLFGGMKLTVLEESETYIPVSTVYLTAFRKADHIYPLIAKGWIPLGDGDGLRRVNPWTDDYVNILDAIRDKWVRF